MRAKIPLLEEAFVGHFTDHHAFLLATMLALPSMATAGSPALSPSPALACRAAIHSVLRRCRSVASTLASARRRVGLTRRADHARQQVGLGAQRPQHPHGGVRDPLGLRGHLVMSGARCRSNHHPQQEPQLVAQALSRPVINYLIQVLNERAISATNSRELPTAVPAGAPGAALGDELLAGSGWDRAGWRHGHGPSRRSAA